MNRFVLLQVVAVLAGCSGEGIKPPGDELMGTFAFNSKGIFAACSLPNFPETYAFDGTFSRFTDGGGVFFTVQGVQYKASFDGQLAGYGNTQTSSYQLADGGSCNACQMTLVETASLALLSRSQSTALGDQCPNGYRDGGVPEPDETAGIRRPGTTDAGFDAVRACGELSVNITGEGFCDPACYSCKFQYRLNGARLQ